MTDNHKTVEELESRLAIINSVQEGLASKLDLQSIVDLVGDKLRIILKTDEIGIRLYDEQSDLVHYLYEFEHGQRLNIPDMKPSALFRQQQQDHLPIFGKTSEISVKYGLTNVPGTEISKSMANVPIISGNKVIGGISVENYEREDAFDETNVRLMQTIAASMGVALENARLFDETQRLFKAEQQRAAELAIINSVQEGLASKLDMQAIYDLVGDKIRDIFEAQSVAIMIYDRQAEIRYYPYLIEKSQRYKQDPIPHDERGFGALVMRTRQPLMVNQDFEKRSFEVDSYDLAGDPSERIKSGIWSPLLVSDQAKGVISVANMDHENAFTESDLRLLTTLASSMSAALENARLFDEVQKSNREIAETLEQQTATSNVLRAIAGSPTEIKPVLDEVAANAASLCEANDVQIYQVEGDLLRQITHYGPLPALQDGEALPLVRGLITGRSVLERKPIHIEDVQILSESEYPDSIALQKRLGHRTVLVTPLLKEETSVGAIVVRRNEVRPFTEKQITLLTTFADQAAIAIENVRLFNETTRLLKETEQRAAELAIINSVQEGLASKLDLQAIYDLVGDKIRDIFDAQSVLICTFDHDNEQSITNYSFEKGQRFYSDPNPLSQFERRLISDRQIVVINENAIQRVTELGMSVMPGTEFTKSLLFVPMIVGNVVNGFISLQNVDHENAFHDSDVRLLTTLTNSMSIALENARLFNETERLLKETEQRAAELAIINSVQEALASKLNMQAIYDLVGDKIRDIFNAQSILIVTYDKTTNFSHFAYNYEKGVRYFPDPRPLSGITGHVIRTRQPIMINENLNEREEEILRKPSTILAGEDIKSRLDVPMLVGGEATGSISLQNVDRENAFSESDLRLLQTLANSMSVALENARLFDETQRLLKETEQRNAELAIINSVQQSLAAKLEIQGIYDAVGEKIADIFPKADVGIRIYDKQTQLVHFPFATEHGKRIYIDPIALQPGVAQHVFNTRKPLLINENVTEETKKLGSFVLPGTDQEKSALYVPIIVGEEARGLVELLDLDREHAFNDSDVRLLSTVANSMSVALENARLFDETQRLLKETDQRAAELQIINSVQEGLASKLEMQDIYDLVGDKIREVFDAQVVVIDAFDHEKQSDRILYGFEKGHRIYDDAARPFPPLVKHLIATRQSIVINDKVTEAIKQYGIMIVPGTESPQSMIFVPFGTAKQINGYFSLQNLDRKNAYTDSDVRLLQTDRKSVV
jgi:GAF domain-containing protein